MCRMQDLREFFFHFEEENEIWNKNKNGQLTKSEVESVLEKNWKCKLNF